MAHFQKRGQYFEYRRRVPKQYADLDTRSDIRCSLKTDSYSVAEKKSKAMDEELERYWASLKKGNSDNARERYEAALEIAASYDFNYKSAAEIATGKIEDVVHRMLTIKNEGGLQNQAIRSAIAGGVSKPELTLSAALERYWEVTRDLQRGKNDDQIRRWKNPKRKAINNLISVIGDKPILSVTWDDGKSFRDYWMARLDDENLTPNSANKDFTHLRTIFKKIYDELRLEQKTPLDDVSFKDDALSERKHFTDDHIINTLLDMKKLEGLNDEAMWTIFAMADTGAGPNELCGLKEEDIVLDADIPYIHIQPNEIRKLKNVHRKRKIPLVGAALLAFQNMPKGYARYKGKNTQLSSVINKYLRENNMLPSSDHSLYSFRHSFEERMLKAGVDVRYRASLMGHKYDRPAYGAGGELLSKQEQLLKIAFLVK